jgi:hypothetical protein
LKVQPQESQGRRLRYRIFHLNAGKLSAADPTTNDHRQGDNVRMSTDQDKNKEKEKDKTVRRLKTYAGAQGYVYQYYFVGQRAALADDPEAPATEFVFDVTSDRKLTYAVSVFLSEEAVAAWAKAHGRPPTEAEQYAAAKLRLFRAFDELEDVKTRGRRLVIDAAVLEESLAGLGVE